VKGAKRCLLHTPGCAAQIGRKGGLRRRVFNPENLAPLEAPASAEDIAKYMAVTLVEVRSARLDPRLANSLAQIGMVFLKALEHGNLEKRIAALEKGPA